MRREATRRGVTGWIRNLPDGRVEAVFEGEEDDVKTFLEFCRRGPPDAAVDSIDAMRERFEGEFDGSRSDRQLHGLAEKGNRLN